jgi:DNA mismatch repair protein MutS2
MDVELKIGFDKVREMVAADCVTEYALDKCVSEAVSTSPDEILHRLKLTDEMRLVCLFEDTFPTGYVDTKPFLMPLQTPSAYILREDLVKLRSSLETIRKILTFFEKSQKDLYPNLRALATGVSYYPEISRRIDLILDKFGEIRDNASPELADIRRSIREKEGSVSKRISAILRQAQMDGIVDSDATASIHDGRVLIPVNASNKNKLPGLVLDESASGKTSFIEPMEVVELNNKIRELHFDEQREILRILVEFSDFLRPYLPDLIKCSEYMGEMDFLNAKARVGISMKASLPLLNSEGRVVLRQARHPLLEKTLAAEGKTVVPLDMTLTREKHILVISGPNAGGKSVCLKTVGLLQYMFQWGLLIPTSEISEMTVFSNMFIDIGDDQSIENDLSTYSSHLVNMKDIVEHCDSSSLVLIDEFGSGTEPAAGGAIAESVLREIDKVGAYAVITTHYTNLKLYADTSTGAVNGAMQFDVANIQPLYKLEMGMPGNSFAFELARKIGLPEQVVHQAEEIAGTDFVSIEKQLRKVTRNRRALDEKLAHIRATDKTLESVTDKYQKELTDIKETKKKIIEEARAEAADIVKEANRQVEATIKQIRESQAEKEKTKVARKGLEDFTKKITEEVPDEFDKQIEDKMAQIIARKQREAERKAQRAAAAEAAAARRAALLAAGLPADSALGGAFGAQLPAAGAGSAASGSFGAAGSQYSSAAGSAASGSFGAAGSQYSSAAGSAAFGSFGAAGSGSTVGHPALSALGSSDRPGGASARPGSAGRTGAARGIDPNDIVPNSPLKVGDKVKVKDSDIIGEVTQISGKKISVAVGSITSVIKIERIERISNNEFRDKRKAASSTGTSSSGNFANYAMAEHRLNFRPEIDIRGQRLDEALVSVQRFMDDALMIGIDQVRILHGKGTGVLREEVRKYVRALPGVVKVEDESFENGGAGITIVSLH